MRVLRRQFLPTLAATPLWAQTANRQRHVVIISIDGFAAYAMRDEGLPLPNFRRLAREGAVAESMEPVNPTVTWPNHTAMVTGVTPARHSVLYNGLAVRGAAGEPLRIDTTRDKTEMVKVPTLYDVAHGAGLTTAEVDWVAVQNAKTITHTFAERPGLTDPILRQMIAEGAVSESEMPGFTKASIIWRDEVWTLAAQHIIEKHRPNVLIFHLLTTDSAQHRYGARSLAGYSALALADAKVGRLLESLTRAGIRDRTAVFVVSDHGFKTYKKVIQANAVLRQKGLLRGSEGAISCDAWVIPEGGTAMVYVTRPERKAEILPQLRAMFGAVPGVARVIEPSDFSRLGYPLPSANDRMADIVLAAAEDHSFSGAHQGEAVIDVPAGATPGAHGYLNTDPDMDAVFIASGAGIKRGTRLGRVRNLDIAPTAARLLGLEMKDVQGRVLTEILG